MSKANNQSVAAFGIKCTKGICSGCPIAQHTEEGQMASDLGCLPAYSDMLKWYNETGKVWACHEDNTKPCVGFIKAAYERDSIRVKCTSSVDLITEQMSLEEIYKDWHEKEVQHNCRVSTHGSKL